MNWRSARHQSDGFKRIFHAFSSDGFEYLESVRLPKNIFELIVKYEVNDLKDYEKSA